MIPIADRAERLAGVMLLGAKRSEEPYSATDRRLLQTIARQAGVVRENLRLRAQVSREQRIRHDVLAHLGGGIAELLKECPACGSCYDGAADRCDADGRTLILSLPVARTIDGKYRHERVLGRGGMGAVYEAYDLRLERTVAVKILMGRAFGEPAALRRFQREARAAARLNHPHVVSVFDYGSLEGDGAFIVMERVHGRTLREELKSAGHLPPPEAARWFDAMLDGLTAAHAEGIVHRDLKPENLVGDGRHAGHLAVKILDFGLAKVREGEIPADSMTVEGVVMGTVGYMSPEQVASGAVDERTDTYAVGVMLVEALTGRRHSRGCGMAPITCRSRRTRRRPWSGCSNAASAGVPRSARKPRACGRS